MAPTWKIKKRTDARCNQRLGIMRKLFSYTTTTGKFCYLCNLQANLCFFSNLCPLHPQAVIREKLHSLLAPSNLSLCVLVSACKTMPWARRPLGRSQSVVVFPSGKGALCPLDCVGHNPSQRSKFEQTPPGH